MVDWGVMTAERQRRVLDVLLHRDGWVTAGDIAERLGVTPRSIRSYVTAVNRAVPDAIASGPSGYRAQPAAAVARDLLNDRDAGGTPRERMRSIIRMLMTVDDGVDVYEAATALHVSDATIEADVRRVRALLDDGELALRRDDGYIVLVGTERSRRRLLARLMLESLDGRAFDMEALRRAAEGMGMPAPGVGDFRRDLVERLADLGFEVNELAVAEVVARVVIAVARGADDHPLPEPSDDGGPDRRRVGEVLDELSRRHLGAALDAADRRHLAGVVLVSLVDAGETGRGPSPRVLAAVREALGRAAEAYSAPLDDDEFIAAFAVHAQNVVRRARERVGARNPMTRSVKHASPLVFEIAVSVASDLADALGVPIPDDEIADIAMRIGSVLGTDQEGPEPLTAVLVCPGFDGLRQRLRAELERALGHDIRITGVETGYEPDWAGLDADLVLTTIDAPAGLGERAVRVAPFLTTRDIARASEAVRRVHRQRELRGLRADMGRWFVPGAFVRNAEPTDPEQIIRMLGATLEAEGVIDAGYIDSAIERERRSPTAFTESLAVPHAMTMTATRTAIAVAVNERAIDWGGERVHVVALVAFGEEDRAAFQTVFAQFVDVFADADNVARIVRRSIDLESFVGELSLLSGATV